MGNIDTCRRELTTPIGEEEALRLMVQGNNEGKMKNSMNSPYISSMTWTRFYLVE
jgi:hypothetical protein